MKKTIGMVAHVDAGKTTFSEQLLYVNGGVRVIGSVNKGTSHLDTEQVERERGITVFSGQALFQYGENTYYFIDTPGHGDFSPETERALKALDYAVLIVSGTEGVQAHTVTLFKLLDSYSIPTFIFINKCDMPNADYESVLNDIRKRLTGKVIFVDGETFSEKIFETVADLDDDFAETWLEGKADEAKLADTLRKMIKNRKAFPVLKGSALNENDVKGFTKIFDLLTETCYNENKPFRGIVYKIRFENGKRLTFIRALAGKIQVKDSLSFIKDEREFSEKINEIRFYNGERFKTADSALAGDIFAVTGLTEVSCGCEIAADGINLIKPLEFVTKAVLEAGVEIKDGTDNNRVLEVLKTLTAEEPSLGVHCNDEAGEIVINTMGKIQLEVLVSLVKERFGIDIAFKKPEIRYKETIAKPVMGYGHFEPLRHYAEVQLRLEPTGVNGGLQFESQCDRERLAENFHRLIEKHIYERELPGVLTGSAITDIKVVLTDGKSHLKHTTLGDFRQATHRAVRQALEKAENVLLEPFYSFEISVPTDFVGRVMADIQKMRGTFEPPVSDGEDTVVTGSAPLETLMDYPAELIAFTGGRGLMTMAFDRYDVCEVAQAVIEKRAYNKGADKANPSSSVFTSHGSSFVVEWYECEQYMHRELREI